MWDGVHPKELGSIERAGDSRMFGYIVINQSELKFKEFDIYHSYYCGLCQSLKERYGATGQLSLNYDMTFILMLLTALYEPETEVSECRCIAHPFEKHPLRRNVFTDYMADMNILFSHYKSEDDWEDDHKLHALLYGSLLARKFRKKPIATSVKVRRIERLMHAFYETEKCGNADIDTMAGLFGDVMGEIVACREDEWEESLRSLGYSLGKFIYLMDAYDDVERDLKKGTFNPLKERYEQPGFEEECRTILTLMMSDCCKEFEQLPILENVEILRNILYSGVWGRYEVVHAKRTERDEKSDIKGSTETR